MARQRQVYPTNEIPHLWAHKTQESARNHRGNLYFNGDTIYSYGSHFPIARHVEHKGRKAILFNEGGWGPTTAKHISSVRGSIPYGTPIFKVPNPTYNTSEQLAYHKREFAKAKKSLLETKNKRARVKAVIALESVSAKAKEFAEFFGYSPRQFELSLPKGCPFTPAQLQSEVEAYREQSEKRSRAAQQAAETRRAVRRAENQKYWEERERQEKEWKEKREELLEAWRNGQNPPALTYWRLAEGPVMLRVVGDEVETSKGATFPVHHAKLALRFIRTVKGNGVAYQRNGHSIHLGHYTVDKIDENGNVTAGCHYVEWTEIERIAPQIEGIQSDANQQTTQQSESTV